MEHKIAWVGLADKKYWEYIAQYCVPSWEKLPGDKFIITDDLTMCSNDFAKLIDLNEVKNHNAQFLNNKVSKKTVNFWKKMQTQRWAISALKAYDWVVLMDTDIEAINFNYEHFKNDLDQIKSNNNVWGIGFKREKLDDSVDSGFIVANMRHNSINTAFQAYEHFWESGEIFTLEKSYDGNVMAEMIKKFPAFLFLTTGYGNGKWLYDFGLFHWGGKLPKEIRQSLSDPVLYVESLVNQKL